MLHRTYTSTNVTVSVSVFSICFITMFSASSTKSEVVIFSTSVLNLDVILIGTADSETVSTDVLILEDNRPSVSDIFVVSTPSTPR